MTMPETYYRTGRYEADHSTFGGVIYDMDFNTIYPISRDIARRIVAAQSFDNWCKYYKGNNYSLPKVLFVNLSEPESCFFLQIK